MVEFKWYEELGLELISSSESAAWSKNKTVVAKINDTISVTFLLSRDTLCAERLLSPSVIGMEIKDANFDDDFDLLKSGSSCLIENILHVSGTDCRFGNTKYQHMCDLAAVLTSKYTISGMVMNKLAVCIQHGLESGEQSFHIDGFAMTVHAIYSDKVGSHTVHMLSLEFDANLNYIATDGNKNCRLFMIDYKQIVGIHDRMAQALIRRYNRNSIFSAITTDEETREVDLGRDVPMAISLVTGRRVECTMSRPGSSTMVSAVTQIDEGTVHLSVQTRMTHAYHATPGRKFNKYFLVSAYLERPNERLMLFEVETQSDSMLHLQNSMRECFDKMKEHK